VRFDEVISFMASSAILVVPNSDGSWLESSVSGEAPVYLPDRSRGPACGKKR
jgi:hypothetical protein